MQQKVYSADNCWSLYHNSCLFLCWSCCCKINSFLQVRTTLLQQTFKYLRDMLFTDTTQDWLSPAWKSCPVHGNRYYFSVRRDGRRAFEINRAKWQLHPITVLLQLLRLVYRDLYVIFPAQRCSWGADTLSANADECMWAFLKNWDTSLVSVPLAAGHDPVSRTALQVMDMCH